MKHLFLYILLAGLSVIARSQVGSTHPTAGAPSAPAGAPSTPAGDPSTPAGDPPPAADRDYWLSRLDRLSRPVVSALAADRLHTSMPVALAHNSDNPEARTKNAYLEAFARLFCGLAPWLDAEGGTQKEIDLRTEYRTLTLKAIANAVNPKAKDYMAWHTGGQTLVDAAFLALALIIDAFLLTRNIQPSFSNWLLFSGMIEAFFCRYGLLCDHLRIDYGIRQLQQWYVGDGVYSDGPSYHWDYYNSYVIHPFLSQILSIANKDNGAYKNLEAPFKQRDERYAMILERLINTDGSFPATGRSIVYRGGAFHHLADMAWRHTLPPSLPPAQIRCALTAVIRKTMDAPQTFTKEGWLNIGLYGDQPGLADSYITTGSGYLCSLIFLPLALPAADEFWSAPPQPWSAQKIWSGSNMPPDHGID